MTRDDVAWMLLFLWCVGWGIVIALGFGGVIW